MIIDDLNIMNVSVMPGKANPPLVVNAYTVLPFALSVQRFEMVARGNPQRFQIHDGVEHIQFPQGDPFDRLELSAGTFRLELQGFLAFVACDHRQFLSET
jgi:hypothetical protein